jgi:hypothetical protein
MALTLWMMVTNKTAEPFTFGGRILVHESREDLEYLFPNQRLVPYKGSEGECMALVNHPDMAAVTFPLDPRDFWKG